MKIKKKVDKKLAARVNSWNTTIVGLRGKVNPSAFKKPGSRKRRK